jgi:hypothetical protein
MRENYTKKKDRCQNPGTFMPVKAVIISSSRPLRFMAKHAFIVRRVGRFQRSLFARCMAGRTSCVVDNGRMENITGNKGNVPVRESKPGHHGRCQGSQHQRTPDVHAHPVSRRSTGMIVAYFVQDKKKNRTGDCPGPGSCEEHIQTHPSLPSPGCGRLELFFMER